MSVHAEKHHFTLGQYVSQFCVCRTPLAALLADRRAKQKGKRASLAKAAAYRHVCGIKLRLLAQYYVDGLRVASHRGHVQSCRAILQD